MKRPRLSLRVRVIVAIAAVALAPHAIVFAWTQLDRPVPGRLWTNVRDATQEAAAAVAAPAPDLDAIANKRGVRLRVVRVADGRVTFDRDADAPTGPGDRLEAFFLRPSGAPTLRAIDDGMGPLLARDETRWAREHGSFVGCQLADLLFCEAVAPARTAAGDEAIVYVEQSSYRAVGEVYQLRYQLLRIGLLFWPIAVVLAWLTGSRITRPIQRLRRQALDRSRPASVRLDFEPGDEVGDLASALNGLIGEVEAERKRHEEFVADLVHELKGTAASVRATADALDGTEVDDRTRRLARVLRDSSAKLETTVSRFLDLARAEDGFPREERETVDVSALARALVGATREDARFADVTFEVDAAEAALVTGVAYRLEAMLRELLENGASFVPRGGHVSVRVRASDDVELVVEDDGPGIPDAERDEIFRRYYTTRGHARGTGLGLALVRAVAEAHGGRAEALGGRARGAAFAVHLPRFTPNSRASS